MINEGLFSSKNAEWRTPAKLFNALDREFGFEWDAAANAINTKTPGYFGPDNPNPDLRDALTIPNWKEASGGLTRFWLNPPYGRILPAFIAKVVEQVQHDILIVTLIPARTDTKWWWDSVLRATEIRFLKGRLKFSGQGTAPFPSAVAIFEPDSVGLPHIEWFDPARSRRPRHRARGVRDGSREQVPPGGLPEHYYDWEKT